MLELDCTEAETFRCKSEIVKVTHVYQQLEWNDYRIEHIARHNIEPDEVWEVCEDPHHLARRHGQNRYLVYGQTADGRYLFVVLESIGGTMYKPITARNMTPHEKRNFRRRRK